MNNHESETKEKMIREDTKKFIRYLVSDSKEKVLDFVSEPYKNRYVNRIIYAFSEEQQIEYLDYIKVNIISRRSLFVELRTDKIDTIAFMKQVSKYNKQFEDSKILFDVDYFSLTELERKTIQSLRLYCFKEDFIKGIVFYPDRINDKKIFYKDILDSKNKGLIQNLNTNIKLFIRDTLLKYSKLEETESSFLRLVNTAYPEGTDVQFNELLIKFQGVVSDIELIENNLLFSDILKQNKCEITWKNLFYVLNFEDIEIEDIDIIIDVLSESKNVLKLANSKDKENYFAGLFYQQFKQIVTINYEEGEKKIIFDYSNVSEYENGKYEIGIITKEYYDDTVSVKSENANLLSLFKQLELTARKTLSISNHRL